VPKVETGVNWRKLTNRNLPFRPFRSRGGGRFISQELDGEGEEKNSAEDLQPGSELRPESSPQVQAEEARQAGDDAYGRARKQERGAKNTEDDADRHGVDTGGDGE
jgi:hypothetical protein